MWGVGGGGCAGRRERTHLRVDQTVPRVGVAAAESEARWLL